MNTRSLIAASALALATFACQDEPTAPKDEMLSRLDHSASRPLDGWFHVIWVDPAPGQGPATVKYWLVNEQGHGTELEVSPRLAAGQVVSGGFSRRKVWLEGDSVAGGRLRVRSIAPVAGPAGAAPA